MRNYGWGSIGVEELSCAVSCISFFSLQISSELITRARRSTKLACYTLLRSFFFSLFYIIVWEEEG